MNPRHLWTTLIIQGKAAPYKMGLLGVLAAVLLVLVGRLLLGGPKTADAAPSLVTAVTITASAQEPARAAATLPRPPMPDVPDTLARDLFQADWLLGERASQPDTAARAYDDGNQNGSEAAPVLLLELTLTKGIDPAQHYAVINGRRVQVGDGIGEFVVQSITPGLVILTGGGTGRTVLRMD